MPGGMQTSQPLFPIDYMRQFGMKYAEWAPPPFDKLPSPPMELGPLGTLPGPSGDSPPAIFRVMHVVSGIDRMFNRLSLNPLQNSDLRPSPKAVKAKVRLPFLVIIQLTKLALVGYASNVRCYLGFQRT